MLKPQNKTLSQIRVHIYKYVPALNDLSFISIITSMVGINNDTTNSKLFSKLDFKKKILSLKHKHGGIYSDIDLFINNDCLYISFDGGETYSISLEWFELQRVFVQNVGDDLCDIGVEENKEEFRSIGSILNDMEQDLALEEAKNILNNAEGNKNNNIG